MNGTSSMANQPLPRARSPLLCYQFEGRAQTTVIESWLHEVMVREVPKSLIYFIYMAAGVVKPFKDVISEFLGVRTWVGKRFMNACLLL